MKPIATYLILVLALIGVIFISGCVSPEPSTKAPAITQPTEEETQQPQPQQTVQQAAWRLGGIAIAGNYADAEIVEFVNGSYRMYYSIEPEVPGNKLEIFSSTSTDGINWKKEEGARKEFATFPDVVKLPDGRFRMYFQNAGVIKSAISTDGLTWTDEPGTRIDKTESGFDLENVGAQGTVRLDDGTYIMVYRGTLNEPYQTTEKIPNKDVHIYFWATSRDGLTFEKKGLAIDSRNDVLLGAADGAEWVRWDQTTGQAELRVYFWSYAGVYHVVYQDGTFSEPVFDFTNNEDKMAKFSPNPPADPTLAKINGKWFMYYGQHTKGIYYATFEQQQSVQQSPSQPPQLSEDLSIPSSIENNCIGFLTGTPEETATIKLIGAGWTRPHPGPFSWGAIEPTQDSYDFSDTDDLVKAAQQNNVLILGTIWPFASWDQEDEPNCKVSEQDQFYPKDPRGRLGIPPYRCKPNDMQAYRKFLSELVERYDGDGERDMQGLRLPIKYWETLNEPDMKSPTLTFFIGNEKDYVEVLKESYQTIKQKCPDCSIVQGGAAGSQQEFLSFWDNVFELGGGNYFDIANIHFIGMGDASTLNVKAFKSLLDKHNIKKPIWVTEAEFGSSGGDVKASMQGALNAGASKIFFVSFKIGGHGPTAPGEYSAEYKEAVQLCPIAS